MSAADSNTSLPEKKSGYTFGHNETLLLISMYQEYEVFFGDVSYKKKGNLANDCRRREEKWLLSVGNKLREQVEMPYFFVPEVPRQQQHICYAMFTRARTAHLDGPFFMQTIRIIPSIPYQPSYSRIVYKKTRPKIRRGIQ